MSGMGWQCPWPPKKLKKNEENSSSSLILLTNPIYTIPYQACRPFRLTSDFKASCSRMMVEVTRCEASGRGVVGGTKHPAAASSVDKRELGNRWNTAAMKKKRDVSNRIPGFVVKYCKEELSVCSCFHKHGNCTALRYKSSFQHCWLQPLLYCWWPF